MNDNSQVARGYVRHVVNVKKGETLEEIANAESLALTKLEEWAQVKKELYGIIIESFTFTKEQKVDPENWYKKLPWMVYCGCWDATKSEDELIKAGCK